MNEKIDELMIQAGARFEMMNWVHYDDFEYKKFAELILKEAITVMNQEWYELNNRKHPEKESDRDIGFRVGQKSQTLLLMGKIKKHFGVE